MPVIQKFLGKTVEIPEDRQYSVKAGLWGKQEERSIVFGMTQPALVLMGGIKGVDWLLAEGQMAQSGESVAFAITSKILYIDTPVAGSVGYNTITAENPALINEDPYGRGWLFRIEPGGDGDTAFEALVSADSYLESLRNSEGFKNPEGIKGGVSGICKAVYSGIGQQKI